MVFRYRYRQHFIRSNVEVGLWIIPSSVSVGMPGFNTWSVLFTTVQQNLRESNWIAGCNIFSHLWETWWRHQMETFSALLAICAGNSPVTGEFTAQRPVTRSFDVFFDLRLYRRLSKQSRGWRFETPSHPLWRHCNECITLTSKAQSTRRCWIQTSNCIHIKSCCVFSSSLTS